MQGIKLQPMTLLREKKYRVIRFLAEGGEGYVYLAQNLYNSNQVCVIKQMFQDSYELEGIEEQYQMFSGLFHPNIVQVLDFFWENDVFYVVMNYVAGESMKNYLRKLNAPMDELKVRQWMTRLAHILDFLHNRPIPIIHADIAPDNVIIAANGDLIVIDFGIARSSFDAVGLREGYSAPEQMNGILNVSCDVYSLGATMYKCLTLKDQEEPAQNPCDENPQVSPRMGELIKRATAPKGPSLFGLIKGRYQDMQELLDGVNECYINA